MSRKDSSTRTWPEPAARAADTRTGEPGEPGEREQGEREPGEPEQGERDDGRPASDDRVRSRPFVVPVAALRRTVGASRHEVRRGVIEGLSSVGVAVPEGEPVEVDVELSSYPGGIAVRGTVRAPWVGECRRCGGPVASLVTAAVRERFTPEGGSEEDEDAYLLTGDELDLGPMARDAVLLDLPLAPLCAPECRGLCPQCGTNWNLGGCGCAPALDPRWSALDALRDAGDGGLA